jgi:hypothetical protein
VQVKFRHFSPFRPLFRLSRPANQRWTDCLVGAQGERVAAVSRRSILVRFRQALDEMYGNQIERVVLFGSRARGDARPASDYDVAVFLKSLSDRWAKLDRLWVKFVTTGSICDT